MRFGLTERRESDLYYIVYNSLRCLFSTQMCSQHNVSKQTIPWFLLLLNFYISLTSFYKSLTKPGTKCFSFVRVFDKRSMNNISPNYFMYENLQPYVFTFLSNALCYRGIGISSVTSEHQC